MDKRDENSQVAKVQQKIANKEMAKRREWARMSWAYKVVEWMRKKVR